jgi:hypothetical protein
VTDVKLINPLRISTHIYIYSAIDHGNVDTAVVNLHQAEVQAWNEDEETVIVCMPTELNSKLEGYTPPKINRWITILTWFTPYRQLFVLTFFVNVTGAILALAKIWPWPKNQAAPLVVGNILIAIAIRSEWVLRFLYWVTVKTFRPKIFPLWLRVKVVGILYHIGKHILERMLLLFLCDKALQSQLGSAGRIIMHRFFFCIHTHVVSMSNSL